VAALLESFRLHDQSSPESTARHKARQLLSMVRHDGSMKRYWTYQLLGWFGFSLVGITINLMAGASPGPLLAGHAFLIGAGIGLTHLFRSVIRRRRIAGQSFSRIWPALALGPIGIGLTLTALVVSINIALTNNKWDPVSIGGLAWGMILASAAWTILYVRFSERRVHADRESHLLLALREAQLRALESQMNPHFLFNCLNSIRALVEIDPPRAQDMLTRLSNVLRNSLRHDNEHTVALSDEMEAVSDYLALESVRFGDRLATTVKVDGVAEGFPVPPMIVQTLVENAIKHGIGRQTGQGQLTVRAYVRDRILVIAVENTGTLSVAESGSPQLGIKNIRERLALLYGRRASLRLEEQDDRVLAMVAIPALENGRA
jgi:two-component system, LytTR family, sensor kinase